MERFSVIFFSFCSLAILIGSMPAGSSIDTLWDNNIRNVENHHMDLPKQKNLQNNTKHLLLNENPVKNTTQVGEYAKNPLYSNNASDASTSTSSDEFSSSYIKDTQHLRHNGDREDDAHRKEGPFAGLSSHDILLDPGLIPARLSRQAEKEKRSPNLESDLVVAEDRYQPSYPYWYPYYRGQFPNQRYWPNNRREPYRNYWRYPVFPGK